MNIIEHVENTGTFILSVARCRIKKKPNFKYRMPVFQMADKPSKYETTRCLNSKNRISHHIENVTAKILHQIKFCQSVPALKTFAITSIQYIRASWYYTL